MLQMKLLAALLLILACSIEASDGERIFGNSKNNITIITDSGARSRSDSIANATADAQSRAKSKSRSSARVRNRVTDRAEADDDRRRGNGRQRAANEMRTRTVKAALAAAEAAALAAEAAAAMAAKSCRVRVAERRDSQFTFVADPKEFSPDVENDVTLTCAGLNIHADRCKTAITINHRTDEWQSVGDCDHNLMCDDDNHCTGVCKARFRCDNRGQLILADDGGDDQYDQQVHSIMCGPQCDDENDQHDEEVDNWVDSEQQRRPLFWETPSTNRNNNRWHHSFKQHGHRPFFRREPYRHVETNGNSDKSDHDKNEDADSDEAFQSKKVVHSHSSHSSNPKNNGVKQFVFQNGVQIDPTAAKSTGIKGTSLNLKTGGGADIARNVRRALVEESRESVQDRDKPSFKPNVRQTVVDSKKLNRIFDQRLGIEAKSLLNKLPQRQKWRRHYDAYDEPEMRPSRE